MKVIHLCLGCFYPDGYSYQENMLPKFHKEQGHDVEVIASLVTFDQNGKGTFLEKGSVYFNEYDIQVSRLEYKKPTILQKKLKQYVGTYESLEKANPDLLFIHGCQFRDVKKVVKYLEKHPHVRVYVDNHADFSNSATNWVSRNIVHKILWRHMASLLEKHVTKFYGVLPSRVDFLKNVYKLPDEKCELLVMGADDHRVLEASNPAVKYKVRSQYDISEDDFLIVTGGKIDLFKRQTLLLMEAVKNLSNKKVKLIIFGSVVPELQNEVEKLCDGSKVQYIGWVKSELSYEYFTAADLVVFPGRHSVFWEQVAAQGIPMVCKYWEGTNHIDLGGNVEFITNDSVDEIQKTLESIINNPLKYSKMKKIAERSGKKMFSYNEIAKRSIEEKRVEI